MFVGWLFTILTALGNKQYIFGIASFFIFPISLVYCAMNYKTSSYSANLLFSGTLMLVCCGGFLLFYLKLY